MPDRYHTASRCRRSPNGRVYDRSVRLAAAALLVALAVVARADDKALRAYDGQIVISPDPAPASFDALPAYLKSNATRDRHYELIKGSPWEINLVGVLIKDPGTSSVTLVIADAADKKAAPLLSSEVSAKRRLVIASAKATTTAGFEADHTYTVQIVQKTTVLAAAELKLRN
jgi:hypothetical protein